jgi:PIN domain nuclease of toxin-antitoxin system
MRLLLDTQIALWWLQGDRRLTPGRRSLLTKSECLLSVASVWEVGVKYRIGKLPLPPQDFAHEMSAQGAIMLSVQPQHVIAMSQMPQGHDDPFDLLIAGTAECEKLELVTADSDLKTYLIKQNPKLLAQAF